MREAENITPPYTAFVFGCSTCPVFVSSLVRLPVTAAVVWPLVRTRVLVRDGVAAGGGTWRWPPEQREATSWPTSVFP